MGIDHTGFSPRVQQKIVYAGVESVSYQKASDHLAALSELGVKPKPVERLVQRIGRERIDQRDAAVAAHQRLPLMARDAVADPERPCPAVAMVSVDGGRIQVRPGPSKDVASERTSHWRESKVSVLETYQSRVYPADPDPHVPRCFLDLKRTMEVVRGLGHALPVGLSFEGETRAREPGQEPDEPKTTGRSRAARPGRPERLVRSVLASRACSDDFAPMMHQAAWERNFFGADRRVFLGDGLAVLGEIQMAAPTPLPCVEQKLARFVQEQPGNSLANYFYAMAIWKRQEQPPDERDLEKVEVLLNKAVAIDAKCGDAYLQLGVLSASQREYEKAIGFYTKAIEVDPQMGEAHYRLGVAYDRIGEPAKAKQEFQLHDEIEKQQAAAVERQRREVKQFLVVLQGPPAHPPAN